MSEQKLGEWISGTDGKKHQVKECQQCKKLFIFMDDKANPKGYSKFNLDGTPHIDAKQFQPRKPSETFRYVHWVKINDGIADQFEVSRTGNVGELDALQTFRELKEIVARLPK